MIRRIIVMALMINICIFPGVSMAEIINQNEAKNAEAGSENVV